MNKTFAFFGTPFVAKETLATLIDAGFMPSVVITNPDAAAGRGMELRRSATKELALSKNLPVLTPEKLDAAATEEIKKFGCEYAIVIAYGKIFPQTLIDIFPGGVYNVHYSLLPKYRGAAPVEAALLHGDEVTGVTVQKLALKMDAGDILAQKEVAIGKDDTVQELFPRLITAGSETLLATLPAIETGSASAAQQDEAAATYAPKIQKEDGLLDLSASPIQNWNKYRAYYFRPGTYFMENGRRIKIKTASFANNTFTPERVVPEGKNETDYADLISRSGTNP